MGVLVNITGGADLTLGEVHQINEIIHDAVGDDAEIIFGAVHEPAMQGEIRVTVIATGFDRAIQPGLVTPAPDVSAVTAQKGAPVIPFPGSRPARVGGSVPARPATDIPRAPRTPAPPVQPGGGSQDLSDMEIPTFIRRQMD
jgi:cell division protein FtsZ